MSKSCKDPNCRGPLYPSNTSTESPGFCKDCGDLVYAFQCNAELPDEWFLVSDGEEPTEQQGVSGNQCGVCGLSEYLIVRENKHTWYAVCVGQVYDGNILQGCQTHHPVRMKRRGLVIL